MDASVSSASRSATIAELIPPPMMTTSASMTLGMSALRLGGGQRLRRSRSGSKIAAGAGVDAGAVRHIGSPRPGVEARQQPHGDVSGVRRTRELGACIMALEIGGDQCAPRCDRKFGERRPVFPGREQVERLELGRPTGRRGWGGPYCTSTDER